MDSNASQRPCSSPDATPDLVQQGPKRFRLGYNRSLDGLRGVAILCVVGSHGFVLPDAFGFDSVDLFFVLSGFLITSLLMQEWQESKAISLRNFYIRRALRLLPALLMLLATFVIYSFATEELVDVPAKVHEALRALFYFTNWATIYHIGWTWFMGHTWSLSIEEQFYILWPPVLLFLLRHCSLRVVLRLISWGIVFVILERLVFYIIATPVQFRMAFGTDTRADSLLAGCLAAVYLTGESPLTPKWINHGLKFCGPASALGLVAMAWWCPQYLEPDFLWNWVLMSLMAVLVILELVRSRRGPLQWILELPVFVYVGKISYGLYLWHFPIFMAVSQHHLPWWKSAPIAITLTLGATLASYYVVELPCLRMKQQFQMLKQAAPKKEFSTPAGA